MAKQDKNIFGRMKYINIDLFFQSIIFLAVMFILIFCIILAVSKAPPFIPNENTTDLTYKKCCGGSYCTDTYYNSDIDKCVLSLCESSLFPINKKDCYYEPKN